MIDWSIIVAIGSAGLAALVALDRFTSKALSVREHEEFKFRVGRDIDRIEKQVIFLEHTRPSTEQLQDAMSTMKEQIAALRRELEKYKV